MPFRDPFEEAWLRELAEEAEDEKERSTLGSPQQPHDAPPPFPPSDVSPPPPDANDGDGDGCEGDGDGDKEVQPDGTRKKDAEQLAKLQ
jgi:hypothetical protein